MGLFRYNGQEIPALQLQINSMSLIRIRNVGFLSSRDANLFSVFLIFRGVFL